MQKPMHVLLVDDDEDEYILLKDLLRHMPSGPRHGEYSIDWAPDLAAALKASQQKSYDLYLVDYYLGNHTGLDVMRQWSAQGSNVPVVLLTGQGNYEVDLAAMQEGASDYLVKSQLNPLILERVFRYTMERKRYTDELEERVRERTQELDTLNQNLHIEIQARKRVEAELRSSEHRLRVMAETTSAAIFIVQEEVIRYANTATRFVTGYTPDELLNQPFWKLAHPAYQDGLRRNGLINQWMKGLPSRFELKIVTKDGPERWVDITAGEMEYDGHSAMIITAFDITERDLAEKELQIAKAELETRVEDRTIELRMANQQLQEVFNELEIEQVRLRTIIENAPGGIVVTDTQGHIVLANPVAEQILGQTVLSDGGEALSFQVDFRDVEGNLLKPGDNLLVRAAAKGESVNDMELLLTRMDGQHRFLLASATPILDSRGASSGAIGIFQDITPRKQREHDLQQSALRSEVLSTITQSLAQAGLDYQNVLNTIALKITETLADGCIIRLLSEDGQWLNPVAAHFRRLTIQDMVEHKPNMLRESVQDSALGNVVTSGKAIALLKTTTQELKDSLQLKIYAVLDGMDICSLIILPLVAQGHILGTLSFIRGHPSSHYSQRDLAFFNDLADRAALAIENAMLHAQVKQLALRDSLTGQYNRRAFFDLGRTEVASYLNTHNPLSAIMLDIDHFKRINDTYGHTLGDDILRMVIDHCRQNIRNTDILGRFGGDEYVILLPRTRLDTAAIIARRICQSVAAVPFETKAGPVIVTVSLGVTEADGQTQNIQDLLDRADKALYQAKRKGRNRVESIAHLTASEYFKGST